MKIALITPKYKEDYETNTILDGLLDLEESGMKNEIHYSSAYSTYLPIKKWWLNMEDFVSFAENEAELIILFWGKGNTDRETAERIGKWYKTVYVDGSELGQNRRFDSAIQAAVVAGKYEGEGRVDRDMLGKCLHYFRREHPYLPGMTPLPFGIERRYRKYYSPEVKKDIDFVCVFGQEDYPPLRREAVRELENFARKTGAKIHTKPTNRTLWQTIVGGRSEDNGREKFYYILARAKVGISVGGGGFDTARFWEILGNNCILLTEKVAIYERGSRALDYDRIKQFGDVREFGAGLVKLYEFIKNSYNEKSLNDEYQRIIREHSSRARALTVLNIINGKKPSLPNMQ